MQRILLIDDDTDICLLLSKFFTKKGYDVATAGRGATALELLRQQAFDLVLCDHRLPDTDSLAMLGEVRALRPGTPVIIITGYSDMRTAVELMRRGAFDYVVKPLYPDEILGKVQEAIAAGEERVTTTKTKSKTQTAVSGYVKGTGPDADTIERHIALVAPTDMTVLISGDTGTGKEYVAKEIHRQSARVQGPFVAIDCGALPHELAGSELFGHVKGAFTGATNDKEGSFEQANGGTLFLDEIGNLTYENQIKLLRVLQERRLKRVGGNKDIDVDVRVLAATNEDLKKAVTDGRFREDLFHRVNEFAINLLPLRDRPGDIPLFAEHFRLQAVQQLNKAVKGFDAPVMRRLVEHQWLGNLRELKNVVKRAVLLAKTDTITVECLPAEIIAGAQRADAPVAFHAHVVAGEVPRNDGLRGAAHSAERQAIMSALERTGFNKSRAAELLNIDRKTLYNKLKALGIEA
ncbi:MAG: sigma-54 dependent transcriptional regulator [Flavobacteriales bacterium]